MRVAFLDTVHIVLKEGLESAGFQCDDLTDVPVDKVTLQLPDYEGIVVRSRFPIDSDFLKKATNLKFIARSGAGMENIDITFCKNNGIQLFNAPEGNRNAVAEHALGMLLMLFNNLHKADREVRKGKWDREGNRGLELDGKIIGIIGFGNNGSAFAKKLRGFEVKILAYDKYKSGFGGENVEEASLERLQRDADILSLHIPQNKETLNLIDEKFIGKMKHPFYLINLSRGKIVKTKDLLYALDSGKILGACLDVLEYEKTSFEGMFKGDIPIEFEELLKKKNVVFSPHVGGWTQRSYYLLSKVLLDKILNFYR